jgi:integrase
VVDDLDRRKRLTAYGGDEQEATLAREVEKERLTGARRAWRDKDLLVDMIEYVLYEHLPSRPGGKRLAPTTIDGYVSLYRNHLRHRLERIRLRDVDGPTFDQLEEELTLAGLDAHTIGIAFTIVRKALAYACRRGVLKHNIGKVIEQPIKDKGAPPRRRESRSPNVDEARALVRALGAGSQADDVNLVLLASGMRVGEGLAMRTFELEIARATHVEGKALDWRVAHDIQRLRREPGRERASWTFGDTKNHTPRDTVIARFALPALDRALERRRALELPRYRCGLQSCRRTLVPVFRGALHVYEHRTPPADGHEPVIAPHKPLAREREDHELLFFTRYGTPMHQRDVMDALASACEVAGVAPVLTPHSLRFAFATLMRHANVPIELVRKMLGHKTHGLTEHLYTKALRSQFHEAMSAYDDLLTG